MNETRKTTTSELVAAAHRDGLIEPTELDRLRTQQAELLAALERMIEAFGENQGRIPADSGSWTVSDQAAINRRALYVARAAIEKARHA